VLRLSKKAEYALMALKDLALRPESEAASAREIAERYEIPVEVMAKVLQRLAKQHVVTSQHGTHGGYFLARPASQISVAEAIEAIDGPVTVTVCSSLDDDCDQYATCTIRDPLWRIKDLIVHALTSYSLQAFVAGQMPAVPIALSTRPSDRDTPLAQMPAGNH